MSKKKKQTPRKATVPPSASGRDAWLRAGGFRRWLFLAELGLAAGLACLVLRNTVTGNGQRNIASITALPEPHESAGSKPKIQDFLGAEACAKCHQKQFELWKSSTHGQAGGTPHEAKVIARFDGQPLRFKDGTVTPLINRRGEYVFALEEPGIPRVEIKVDAVVGGGHMYGGGTQSFFHKFDDGTLRFLPFDFIRRENLWFVQRRRDLQWVPISPELSIETDLANWPPQRVLGASTEFSNCQNCHGSQVTLAYDPNTRKFQTHFQSLRINCESCHGPGKRHVELASRPDFRKNADIGMRPLAALSKEQSVIVCFQCHATKEVLREETFLPGEALEAFFSVKMPQFEGTYTPDGRVSSFGYQGNHLYSDCFRNGSMTCVDCHNPHSQEYRDVFGNPLAGKFDNRQCTSCHASKGLVPEQHSHHKAESAGNLCTSCHMPFLQHRGVGQHLQFARSDHSIPIPRPAFDEKLGIENACRKCHGDKDVGWQEAKVREWYGELKPHPAMVANLLKAAEVSDAKAAASLLLAPGEKHAIGQASGLISFIQRFLHPGMDPADRTTLQALKAFSQNPDPDLQALALTSLQIGYERQPDIHTLCAQRLQAMPADDPVRLRWAIADSYRGDAFVGQGDRQSAIFCFSRSLEVNSANVVTLSHLARAQMEAGDNQAAAEALQKAIALQPSRAVLHFQLAVVWQRQQRIEEAIRELQEGLKYSPDDATANRMLQQLRMGAKP